MARSVGHAPSCQRGNSPGRPSSLKNILYILIKTPAYRALLRASTPFAPANRPGNTHGQPPRRACTLCPLVDTNAEGAYLPLLLLAFGCHRRETFRLHWRVSGANYCCQGDSRLSWRSRSDSISMNSPSAHEDADAEEGGEAPVVAALLVDAASPSLPPTFPPSTPPSPTPAPAPT